MFLIVIIIVLSSELPREMKQSAKKTVCYHLDKANQMTKTLETSKRKETNNPYAERENILKEK